MKRANERGRDAPDARRNVAERRVSLLAGQAGSGNAGVRADWVRRFCPTWHWLGSGEPGAQAGGPGLAQAIAHRCRCFSNRLSGGNLPGVVLERRLVAGAA